MRLKSFTFFAALGAFLLAACGAAPSQTWPGLTTNGELAFVASGQQVHAVRVADGGVAWAFPAVVSSTTGIFVADPAVSPDVIVVGAEGPTNSYSGVLYGLDAAAGTQNWCLAFDQKGATRAGCPLAQGSPEAGLFGLAPAIDNRIIGGLTVAEGVAYVGLANGKFYAVDVATGRDKWLFPGAQRDIWAPPLILGDTIYVSSLDHHLYAINTADGTQRWAKDLGAAVAGTPTPSEDGATLYIGTFGSELYALDAKTGEVRWGPITAKNWIWAGPTLADGVLYFTDVGGYVNAVDAATGSPVWAAAVKPGGLMRARPAMAGDLLYVGDRDGNLFGLNRNTGAVVWTQTLKGQILAPILVVNELVLVAPFNGDNLLVGYSLDGTRQPLAFAPTK